MCSIEDTRTLKILPCYIEFKPNFTFKIQFATVFSKRNLLGYRDTEMGNWKWCPVRVLSASIAARLGLEEHTPQEAEQKGSGALRGKVYYLPFTLKFDSGCCIRLLIPS